MEGRQLRPTEPGRRRQLQVPEGRQLAGRAGRGDPLVLRCPENATPWISGASNVNQQVCACIDGFVASKLVCVPRERSKDKICDDATYDTLKDQYEFVCKKTGGMSCSDEKMTKKQYSNMTCDDAKANLAKQSACLAARKDFQKQCFAAVDPRHQVVLDQHANGVVSCEALVQEKCGK